MTHFTRGLAEGLQRYCCCLLGVFVCLFVCLLGCWGVCLFVCVCVCLFVCLFVGVFVCLFVCFCYFVCLFVSLFANKIIINHYNQLTIINQFNVIFCINRRTFSSSETHLIYYTFIRSQMHHGKIIIIIKNAAGVVYNLFCSLFHIFKAR